jgi:hypothetical protein
LIAFVAQALAMAALTDFPKFAWWTITYELFCILAVAFIISVDAVPKYHVAVSITYSLEWSQNTSMFLKTALGSFV